jgi:hypothetical protein
MSSVVKKVMFVGRATVFMVGLAVILALTVGVASAAFGANGGNFILGQTNAATAITRLAGAAGVAGPSLQIDNNSTNAAATALDLQVEAGKAPMKVNSDTQVANLNADKVDGKSAGEIGVNGLERVSSATPTNSDSGKVAIASCPTGKVLVGSGYNINGGVSGNFPNQEADVVIDEMTPLFQAGQTVVVEAYEEEPTSANWSVIAFAVCATAP